MGKWKRQRRRSKAETPPGCQPSTSLGDHDGGCGAAGTPSQRDAHGHAGENRRPDGAHAHDRVSRVRGLYHQARPDGGDGHGFQNQLGQQNIECVCAWVTVFPLSRSGSCQTTCTWLLIAALTTRSKPGRLRSTVFRPKTTQNLRGFKPPRKTRSVDLQQLALRVSRRVGKRPMKSQSAGSGAGPDRCVVGTHGVRRLRIVEVENSGLQLREGTDPGCSSPDLVLSTATAPDGCSRPSKMRYKLSQLKPQCPSWTVRKSRGRLYGSRTRVADAGRLRPLPYRQCCATSCQYSTFRRREARHDHRPGVARVDGGQHRK